MTGGSSLPRRFYQAAGIVEGEGGFALVLDDRPARTPARRGLVLPTRALGEAVAAEWEAQVETVDPRRMPLTRLANTAIDGVGEHREAVVEDCARYAGSDLVIYRAGAPESLAAEQGRVWDPVLAWAAEALGARFFLGEGVMHVGQPPEAVAAVRAAVAAAPVPFGLAALHAMTTLGGSVLIALAVVRGRLSPAEGFEAAELDELYQRRVWGGDEEAAARTAARRAEFDAAARLHALASQGGFPPS